MVFWVDMAPYKGPQHWLVCCFRHNRETRTHNLLCFNLDRLFVGRWGTEAHGLSLGPYGRHARKMFQKHWKSLLQLSGYRRSPDIPRPISLFPTDTCCVLPFPPVSPRETEKNPNLRITKKRHTKRAWRWFFIFENSFCADAESSAHFFKTLLCIINTPSMLFGRR